MAVARDCVGNEAWLILKSFPSVWRPKESPWPSQTPDWQSANRSRAFAIPPPRHSLEPGFKSATAIPLPRLREKSRERIELRRGSLSASPWNGEIRRGTANSRSSGFASPSRSFPSCSRSFRSSRDGVRPQARWRCSWTRIGAVLCISRSRKPAVAPAARFLALVNRRNSRANKCGLKI
jgi:hypothetical protein